MSLCTITVDTTVTPIATIPIAAAVIVSDARPARLNGECTPSPYPFDVDNFQDAEPGVPPEFALVVEELRETDLRDELRIREIPPPGGIAPYAFAVAADIGEAPEGRDSEHGTGRFILMYDPDEPEAWRGPFRVVSFTQAPQDADIAKDPFLAEVTWSWLEDALAQRGARHHSPSGTATKIISAGFGELADQREGAQIELRASWTPMGGMGAHLAAWSDLLCALAGLSVREGEASIDRFAKGEQ